MARLKSRINSRQTLRFFIDSPLGFLTAEDGRRLLKRRFQVVYSIKIGLLAKQVFLTHWP